MVEWKDKLIKFKQVPSSS